MMNLRTLACGLSISALGAACASDTTPSGVAIGFTPSTQTGALAEEGISISRFEVNLESVTVISDREERRFDDGNYWLDLMNPDDSALPRFELPSGSRWSGLDLQSQGQLSVTQGALLGLFDDDEDNDDDDSDEGDDESSASLDLGLGISASSDDDEDGDSSSVDVEVGVSASTEDGDDGDSSSIDVGVGVSVSNDDGDDGDSSSIDIDAGVSASSEDGDDGDSSSIDIEAGVSASSDNDGDDGESSVDLGVGVAVASEDDGDSSSLQFAVLVDGAFRSDDGDDRFELRIASFGNLQLRDDDFESGERTNLTVDFNLEAWFDGVDRDSLEVGADGVIHISSEDNGDAYRQIVANLRASATLRDDD